MFSTSLLKKTFFIAVFSVVSVQAQVLESTQAECSSWQKIKDSTALARDFVLDCFAKPSFMGSNPASPEVDTEVREILKSIHFSGADTIRLRQLSGTAMGTVGDKCALAFGVIGLPKYIFIAEEWFKTLSYDQKRFLIAHEVAHITNHHTELNAIIGIVLGRFFTNYIVNQVDQTKKLYSGLFNKPVVEYLQITECLHQSSLQLMQFLAAVYPAMLIYRATQMQADDSALRATRALNGGVSLMNIWKENGIKLDSELPQWKILKWLRKIKYMYFTPDPTLESRIAYLQELDRKLVREK